MREQLIAQLEHFVPFNEQEANDLPILLHYLRTHEDIFYRTNLFAHMTVSAWIVNPERTKTVMAYHNLYDSWAWLGGHADGDEDLLAVALKEVNEESGLTHIRPVSEEVFSVEVLPVYGHVKKGKYVPSHLHLNVTYLVEADEADTLHHKADENSAVRWFDFQSALEASNELWFKEHIYQKLMDKLK